MSRNLFSVLLASLIVCTISLGTSGSTSAQDTMPSCMFDVAMQPLAQAMPANADGLALLVMRLTIGPDGGFKPHTHLGTVTVTVESGTLDFTLLENEDMVVHRVSTDGTPVPADTITPNRPVTVHAGDWFVESGSVHEAWNRSADPAVLIVSALVDPDLPFMNCVASS